MNCSEEYLKVAREFAAAVRRRTSAVKQIVLFGSVARGAATEESDIDVALVVDPKDSRVRDAELEAAEEMMNRHGTLFGCLLLSVEEWNRLLQMPFGKNLVHDGVVL